MHAACHSPAPTLRISLVFPAAHPSLVSNPEVLPPGAGSGLASGSPSHPGGPPLPPRSPGAQSRSAERMKMQIRHTAFLGGEKSGLRSKGADGMGFRLWRGRLREPQASVLLDTSALGGAVGASLMDRMGRAHQEVPRDASLRASPCRSLKLLP